jgi:hypothetical protein
VIKCLRQNKHFARFYVVLSFGTHRRWFSACCARRSYPSASRRAVARHLSLSISSAAVRSSSAQNRHCLASSKCGIMYPPPAASITMRSRFVRRQGYAEMEPGGNSKFSVLHR